MKLRYEITEEELVAFNLHHFQTSPVMKQTMRRSMIVTGMATLVLLALFGLTGRARWEILAPLSVVASLIAVLAVRRKFPKSIEQQVRRNVAGSYNKALFGTHELELEDDWLVERTEVSAHRQAWRAVERIVETDDFVYFYLSPVNAHMVPKRQLPAAEVEAFVNRARQLLAAAQPAAQVPSLGRA